MVITSLLAPFTVLFEKNESSTKTYTKPTYYLFKFLKMVANQPTNQTAMAALHRRYAIKNQIGTTIKVLYIQRLNLRLGHPGDQVLRLAYR